jgi:UDP-N-acetylmuramoylalanine--D-glutamate ligase
VLFVDDSKSTTLDSTAAAVKSFERPVRLLLGGVFKGGEEIALGGGGDA